MVFDVKGLPSRFRYNRVITFKSITVVISTMKAFIIKTSPGECERILLVTPNYCAPLEKWFTETYTNKNFENDGVIIDNFEKKFPAQFLEFIKGETDFAVGTFEVKWSRQAVFL